MEVKTRKAKNNSQARKHAPDKKPFTGPATETVSRFRAIGNSRGVILNNKLISASGLKPDADIVIHAGEGMITIVQAKQDLGNTDLSTWDAQFKACIKKGAKPKADLFGGMKNNFDDNEW